MKMIASRKLRFILIGTIVAALLWPLSSALAKHRRHGKTKVKVMTRNLYLGADIFRVVDAALYPDPDLNGMDVPLAVAEVFQTMRATNFPERAEAIAEEIFKTKPDVIGIQEASTYFIQTPGDFLAGNPVQANHVVIDFYAVLNEALVNRGLHYNAYFIENADIELPMADPEAGPPDYLSDVRLVDRDMILVRKRLESQWVTDGHFENQLAFDIGDVSAEFTRGYLVVDVKVKKDRFRFVNTHLEVRSTIGSPFRVAQYRQMQELLDVATMVAVDDPKPVVLLGDFNSSPDDVPGVGFYPGEGFVPYVPPYRLAVEAGYQDTWLLQKRFDEGYTSGFDEYVSDPTAKLTTRIDHIFVDPCGDTVSKVKADVVGDEVEDMTPNGLWPSDHAGVVANIQFWNQHKKRSRR